MVTGHELGDRSMMCSAWSSVAVLELRSRLAHDGLGASNLALDLLTSPSGSLDGAGLVLSVGSGLLDHSSDPVLSESIRQLAVGEGISQIAAQSVSDLVRCGDDRSSNAYPMTPMHERINASLRFMSFATVVNRRKMASTYCCSTWFLPLVFMAPMMPPQASMMPSLRETT
jgi:hypothetical protein